MSTTEILKELPKLSQKERQAIIRRLQQLQECETGKPAARKTRPLRYSDLGLLTQNPSFDFLREEPDLYE